MTAVTTPKSAPTPAVPGVQLPLPQRTNPRRRSPAMVSLGVILVVLGALAGWRFVGVAASGTKAYLAVYQQVPMGSKLTADELQVVHVTPVNGLLAVPASDMSQVVGSYARVDLYPGTLLTADQLTRTPSPGSDEALVGLQLNPDQRPGRQLHAGNRVMLVAMPDPAAASDSSGTSGSGSSGSAAALPTWSATVIDVSLTASDGSQVVDVLVARADLTAVTAMASADRIAVALISVS
jgi:hypothetical protein